MKKFAALLLALSLVMGLSMVATATVTPNPDRVDSVGSWHTAVDNVVNLSVSNADTAENKRVSYTATIYAPLLDTNGELVIRNAAAEKISTKVTYTVGRENVAQVRIVASRYEKNFHRNSAGALIGGQHYGTAGNTDDEGTAYFIAITFKGERTAESDYATGVVTIKRSSGEFAFDNIEVPFNMQLSQAYRGPGSTTTTDTDIVDDTTRRFQFGGTEGEYQLEMKQTMGRWTFETEVTGQPDILLSCTVTANNDIWALYPDAYLEFYNGNRANFARVGTMEISSYEDRCQYIYERTADNILVEMPNVEFDGETFSFRTRTLGQYVLSDVELDLSLQNVGEEVVDPEAPTEEGEEDDDASKAIPDTGARA